MLNESIIQHTVSDLRGKSSFSEDAHRIPSVLLSLCEPPPDICHYWLCSKNKKNI